MNQECLVINDGPSIMKFVDGWYKDDTHDEIGPKLVYILYIYIRHPSQGSLHMVNLGIV